MKTEAHRTETPRIVLGMDEFDAVIFDLDGVVTQTATVHAAAWKAMFDEFLRQRADETGNEFRPFDVETDYRLHVDGKPRYDGVADFLRSRGIALPYGDPSDPTERETICGLGNRKNRLYLENLKQGVKVYDSTVELIRKLREQGIRTAVISASRNCAAVLDAARIANLFDARVDGMEAERLALAGKPAPDVFLEAARQLGATPDRSAVVEDAIAGVQAGRQGGFRLVVGVNRGNYKQALMENGAHEVVSDLEQIDVMGETTYLSRNSDELPSALDSLGEIRGRLRGKRLAAFLDYDGTLTPIVERPELAQLSDEMREAIRALAQNCFVAVVSGRDLPNVQSRVGLQEIVYAGSHGFEIRGPEGMSIDYQGGTEFLPHLDRAEQALRERLGSVPGSLVERKKYSIAIHYRQVNEADAGAVGNAVDAVRADNPQLRKTYGKDVYELQPDIDWNKGRAIFWLLEKLGLLRRDVLVLYIGDDITDEDAFRALNERGGGIGILVRDRPRETYASYALDSTDEVRQYLEELASLTERAKA